MPVRRSLRPVAVRRLENAAYALLDAVPLCAISTISPRGNAHVSTAYFAWNRRFEVVWLSSPSARHSRNIAARPSTAIAVYETGQRWGEPDRGIQLFGSSERVSRSGAADAETSYSERFRAYKPAGRGDYAFFRFRAVRLKVFDEAVLGGGTFVTAHVRSGQLTWEMTEIYDARGDSG
jgi:Pyridoxamine 5'-phosphate oxidase